MSDSESKRIAIKWRPVASAIVVTGAGYYAWLYGLTALPPVIALLILGCAANVVYDLLKRMGPTRNALSNALQGIALMLSLVCGVVLVLSLLWVVFSAETNPITKLMAKEDAAAVALGAFVLAMFLLIGSTALISATAIWLMVKQNALGPQQPAEPT